MSILDAQVDAGKWNPTLRRMVQNHFQDEERAQTYCAQLEAWQQAQSHVEISGYKRRLDIIKGRLTTLARACTTLGLNAPAAQLNEIAIELETLKP